VEVASELFQRGGLRREEALNLYCVWLVTLLGKISYVFNYSKGANFHKEVGHDFCCLLRNSDRKVLPVARGHG
jgi:hypothetical protein